MNNPQQLRVWLIFKNFKSIHHHELRDLSVELINCSLRTHLTYLRRV